MREPGLVALAPEREREAAVLLAGLLIDAVAKRRAVVTGGVLDGVFGGAFRGVIPFPEQPGTARRAA